MLQKPITKLIYFVSQICVLTYIMGFIFKLIFKINLFIFCIFLIYEWWNKKFDNKIINIKIQYYDINSILFILIFLGWFFFFLLLVYIKLYIKIRYWSNLVSTNFLINLILFITIYSIFLIVSLLILYYLNIKIIQIMIFWCGIKVLIEEKCSSSSKDYFKTFIIKYGSWMNIYFNSTMSIVFSSQTTFFYLSKI